MKFTLDNLHEKFEITSPDSTEKCTLCPRNCGGRRSRGELGYCRTGVDFSIARICRHRGEEPVLLGNTGICNIFFTHCNLQCLFCQNYQISRNNIDHSDCELELGAILEKIEKFLGNGGRTVGFVSPSHCIPQMKTIIKALWARGQNPTFVMNTNAYDKRGTISSLEEYVHVYLPDLKYMDGQLAGHYSGAADYPGVAAAALKEMFRQKGADIEVDPEGVIQTGLIIRHLVLPGQIENSKACLRFIAEELSPDVHISLMAQYRPTPLVKDHPDLGRPLQPVEYEEVLLEMEKLGFSRGWIQSLESRDHYVPDFERGNIFE